jgi:predicted nucleic acid-binding protein
VAPTVLDTDVASLLHRRALTGPLASRLIDREPLITFVTFGELAKWAEIRNWGQRRREELTSWLSRIAVLPGDEAVAATWGRLSAAAIRRGRPRPVGRAVRAAARRGTYRRRGGAQERTAPQSVTCHLRPCWWFRRREQAW